MVFSSEPRYLIMPHAIERYAKRIDEEADEERAKAEIRSMLKKGDVILVLNNHKYIRYEEVVLPCVRTAPGVYAVKTVLTWDMAGRRIMGLIDQMENH